MRTRAPALVVAAALLGLPAWTSAPRAASTPPTARGARAPLPGAPGVAGFRSADGASALDGTVADTPSATPATDAAATRPRDDEEVARLSDDLLGLLGRYRWGTATWGVLVASLDNGDTLFAWNADSLMAPASNMKLLTTVGALQTLGPEFRFRTYLLTRGRVDNGVLHGDLVLYGTGDPGISDRFYPSRTFVFESLARQLRDAGIHAIRGDLVADASFLPGPLRPPTWDPADLDDHFAPGISALSYNENVLSLRLEPAPAPGLPPRVHTLPDHAGVEVENMGVTVDGPARPRISVTRDHPLAPFRVQGEIRRGGRDVWRQMTVPVPARFAGSAFQAVLEDTGIRISGGLRVVDAPARSVVGGQRITAPAREGRSRTRILAHHVSPPLRDYLAVVNKESNNLFAELVFHVMGRAREGSGDAASAAEAVADAMARLGVEASGLVQLDGSGLSEGNRVAPATFVQLLQEASEAPLWPELWQTLPQAGRRRELPRMYRTAAAGNLRAKTGTIARVSALTGVVHSAQGERLAFSILVNGTPSTSRAKAVENAIGARLASFSRAVAPPTRTAQLPPPVPSPETGGTVRHRVAPGENLGLIARRYGLSLEALVEANPGVEPSRLRAGSILLVPPAEAADEAAGAAPQPRR